MSGSPSSCGETKEATAEAGTGRLRLDPHTHDHPVRHVAHRGDRAHGHAQDLDRSAGEEARGAPRRAPSPGRCGRPPSPPPRPRPPPPPRPGRRGRAPDATSGGSGRGAGAAAGSAGPGPRGRGATGARGATSSGRPGRVTIATSASPAEERTEELGEPPEAAAGCARRRCGGGAGRCAGGRGRRRGRRGRGAPRGRPVPGSRGPRGRRFARQRAGLAGARQRVGSEDLVQGLVEDAAGAEDPVGVEDGDDVGVDVGPGVGGVVGPRVADRGETLRAPPGTRPPGPGRPGAGRPPRAIEWRFWSSAFSCGRFWPTRLLVFAATASTLSMRLPRSALWPPDPPATVLRLSITELSCWSWSASVVDTVLAESMSWLTCAAALVDRRRQCGRGRR